VSSSGSIFVKICGVIFVYLSSVSYIHKKVHVFGGIMGCANVGCGGGGGGGFIFYFFIFALYLYSSYLPLKFKAKSGTKEGGV
jgi:hypothetical protein